MTRISTIELFKEEMKFSAGHFTIFSSEIRENLHGHNYNVYVSMTTVIGDEGLSYDYRFYKDKFYQLCASLNEIVLLPGRCKHLSFEEKGDYYHIKFNNEVMIFLKRDIKILPVTNISVEELSNWFIEQIKLDETELEKNNINDLTVKVFSGPGQSGSSTWKRNQSNKVLPSSFAEAVNE